MAAPGSGWNCRSATRRDWCSNRSRRPLARRLVLGWAGWLAVLPLQAATIVPGQVTDPTTGGSPVGGARIEARLGTAEVGRTTTDQEGKFQLTVDVPAAGSHSLELEVTHASYDPQAARVTINAGRPNPLFSKILLMPKGVGGCRPSGAHVGIVGHFGTPGEAGADFPRKIADALTRNLVTRVQREHLPEGYLPYFEPCAQARPRSYLHGPHFARALEADIFVSGDLNPADGGYDVYAWVSDRYDVFNPPLAAENRAVNLNNPQAAQLEVETLAAILVAVARSYEKDGRQEECVDVTRAAEYLRGELTAAIEAQRRSCRGDLGHVGLTREASP